MSDKWLSTEEAAAKYNLKPGTIRKWLWQGKIKGIKAGRLWRLSEEELERFIVNGSEPEPVDQGE